ncbi:MAG: efflux RND transporter periplasmic adaptor subunit [Alphaproteobacteria bacterium]|nr:efflux RND transporter periplasmic adaptor subunit [Alphaproteobacteria bacterium]
MHLLSPPRALLAVLVAILWLSLIAPVRAADDEVRLTPAQMANLGVRVARPVSSKIDQTLPFPSQIVIPIPQLWVVSAPVSGMVTNLAIARGDRLSAGQALVTLESPSFVSLQRDYLHAMAQNVLATQQLNRNQALFDGKAVPQRVLETSQAEARQAHIAFAERRQMLRLAGMADEDIARLADEVAISATLTVRAPRESYVVDIGVSPGQRLEQAAAIVKLAQLSPLWVEIAVPAANMAAIRMGARVDIEGYNTPGRVIMVSQTTDAATQTVMVRAEVPNQGLLHPGQSAASRISFVSPAESAWEIPYAALVRRGENTSVFVAIDGGFRLVPVVMLAEDQDHVVVSGPISNTDEVAVGGISALRGILLGLGAGQ